MLVLSNNAAENRITNSFINTAVDLQTNSQCSATIAAPPTGQRSHLVAVLAGYTSGGTGALALPNGQSITVTGQTDATQQLANPFVTGSTAVTLAAGGSGKVGYLTLLYEFVG